MKTLKSDTAARHRLNSRSEAKQWFDTLPAKFQKSMVGGVYQKIIDHLGAEGAAPLDTILAELFPDREPAAARRSLANNFANRPHLTELGLAPLRLRLSPANETPATVWFESEASKSLQHETPDTPHHSAQTFAGGLAAQATGEEVKKAEIEKSAEVVKTAALRQGAIEAALNKPDQPRTYAGLRKGTETDLFTDTTAQQHSGHAANADMDGAEKSSLDERKTRASQTVVCLEAMLQWAVACKTSAGKTAANTFTGEPAHRLLTMLGDYGTGKTSHCMQFARVLNGDVANEAWAATQESARARNAELPQALYLDLAELAGVSNLGELGLGELLHIIQNRAHAGLPGQTEASLRIQGLIERARAGSLILVFDGLDELLKTERAILHKVFAQLLKVLEASPQQKAQGQSSRARIIVSCRTHYFRDIEEQHAFFNTRQRGVAQAGDYLCLTMLPWSADNISTYLGKRLPPDQADELANIIKSTYNLEELASRPVLLAMMSEQLGELLRLKELGEPITAQRLYGITVSEWTQRDNGKHRIAPQHKALLMGALAAAMWSEGVEAWSAERLDRWLLPTVALLFPHRYDAAQAEAIQDDLRTATFIVRPDASRFSFAHRSFLEYFLARFVWDALELCRDRQIAESELFKLLPARSLNLEAKQFLREICAAQLSRLGTDELRRRSLPLWHLLQGKDLPSERRVHLWQLAMDFDLTAETPLIEKLQQTLPLFDAASLATPINLAGTHLMGQQWQDKDFSWLPPLDLRGANLLGLRAHRCRFGKVMCDAQTNWAQALLRYCDTSQVDWNGAERGGLLVRQNTTQAPMALKLGMKGGFYGPWVRTKGQLAVNAVAISRDGKWALTGSNGGTAHLWEINSGRELRQFKDHGAEVTSVAISPDGASVVTCDHDGTARLSEVTSGRELRQFEGHEGSVTSVAFSPDGAAVLTGSLDGTARLWEVTSGRELRQFNGNGCTVESVAFSPDGAAVLTGSQDGSARLWRINAAQKPESLESPCTSQVAMRCFVHGEFAPSSAAFDAEGNLLDWDDEAIDTWLFTLHSGTPEPIEMHPDYPALMGVP